ncbi:MAG: hypothetical protein IMW99_07425 [Firmicutes bacterium]|nr:hypothetical protein [Bacillota bacterium]
MKRSLILVLAAAVAMVALVAGAVMAADAPKIPQITVADDHPNGCVDCHRKISADKDYSLQAEIKNMANEKKHPDVAAMIKSPKDCVKCHGANSKYPLGDILHQAHLSGPSNHFVSAYQGQCLYCHKYDKATGKMTVKGL